MMLLALILLAMGVGLLSLGAHTREGRVLHKIALLLGFLLFMAGAGLFVGPVFGTWPGLAAAVVAGLLLAGTAWVVRDFEKPEH